MPDFNVRSDAVNVEQIMEQIRARIREKRGVDYTEQQIRELAAVKLEKFLDPKGVRSDLLEQFKKHRPSYEPPIVPAFTFEDTTIYETHRGPLRLVRKLLNPILKLLFNPNPLIHALHTQVDINRMNLEREVARDKQRRDRDGLYFEVIHNLVLELTRAGIEVKNLKMRVESLASRLEFNERRARALESVVVYKPSADEGIERAAAPPTSTGATSAQPRSPGAGAGPPAGPGGPPSEGPGQRSRRRRRRRGRRGGGSAAAIMGGSGRPASSVSPDASTVRNEDAAREAGEPHAAAAENIEQAMGADAHPSEPAAKAGPPPPSGPAPGGTDPNTR